jgi:hypothetical protein
MAGSQAVFDSQVGSNKKIGFFLRYTKLLKMALSSLSNRNPQPSDYLDLWVVGEVLTSLYRGLLSELLID